MNTLFIKWSMKRGINTVKAIVLHLNWLCFDKAKTDQKWAFVKINNPKSLIHSLELVNESSFSCENTAETTGPAVIGYLSKNIKCK